MNYLDNELLVKQYQCGDSSALLKLIEANSGLIKYILKHIYFGYICDYDDLLQVAYMSFIEAAQKYDGEYLTKFSTYAVYYMTGKVLNYLNNNRYSLHITSNQKNMISQYEKMKKQNKSDDEIMKIMKLDEEKYKKFINDYNLISAKNLSLDEKIYGEESNNTIKDVFPDQDIYDPIIDKVFNEEFRNVLKDILSEEEYEIICMRFGIECKQMTQDEVAKIKNKTHQAISGYERKILNKLKNNKNIREFNNI